MSSSPLLLFKSGSLRRRTTTDAAGIGRQDESSSTIPQSEPPHRLRRVFTTHACRRSSRSGRQQEVKTAGHASPLQWRMTAFMKKPLGIANSVPLGVPLNFNRSGGIYFPFFQQDVLYLIQSAKELSPCCCQFFYAWLDYVSNGKRMSKLPAPDYISRGREADDYFLFAPFFLFDLNFRCFHFHSFNSSDWFFLGICTR